MKIIYKYYPRGDSNYGSCIISKSRRYIFETKILCLACRSRSILRTYFMTDGFTSSAYQKTTEDQNIDMEGSICYRLD